MKMKFMATQWALIGLLPLFSACGSTETQNGSDDGDLQRPASLAAEPAPTLDVDTAQTDTPAGTVDAARASSDTYVGTVTENLYIAVTLDEGPEATQPQRALAYLCDGQYAEYLAGDVGEEPTLLQGQMMDVELALVDGSISGRVIPSDEEPLPFTTEEASGVAGLYAATFEFEEDEYYPVWVVLPDGSQRGGACWMCCAQECYVCCPTTADTAGPTVDWTERQYWWRRWFRS